MVVLGNLCVANNNTFITNNNNNINNETNSNNNNKDQRRYMDCILLFNIPSNTFSVIIGMYS